MDNNWSTTIKYDIKIVKLEGMPFSFFATFQYLDREVGVEGDLLELKPTFFPQRKNRGRPNIYSRTFILHCFVLRKWVQIR